MQSIPKKEINHEEDSEGGMAWIVSERIRKNQISK